MRRFALITLLLLPLVWAAARPLGQKNASSAEASGSSYLGVAVMGIDDNIANELQLHDEQGALVRWVADGSPASRAGIKRDDIILQFNGKAVKDASDLGRFVHEVAPGRKAKLKINRDGKIVTVPVTLAALRSPSAPVASNSIRLDLAAPDFFTSDMPLPALLWRNNVLGIEYEGIDAQLAAYFGVKQGLLVRYVLDRSAGEAAGLKAGDVLVKVASRPCVNPRDVGAAIRSHADQGKPITLEIVRDRKLRTLAVTVENMRQQATPE
jgi:serine protease Do